ncbi:unnamed protein product [Gadus morhua 'NCC']
MPLDGFIYVRAVLKVVDEEPLSVGPGVAVVQVNPAAGGIDGQPLVRARGANALDPVAPCSEPSGLESVIKEGRTTEATWSSLATT